MYQEKRYYRLILI